MGIKSRWEKEMKHRATQRFYIYLLWGGTLVCVCESVYVWVYVCMRESVCER